MLSAVIVMPQQNANNCPQHLVVNYSWADTVCAVNHLVRHVMQRVLRCAQLDMCFEKFREGQIKFTCKGYEKSHLKAECPQLPVSGACCDVASNHKANLVILR